MCTHRLNSRNWRFFFNFPKKSFLIKFFSSQLKIFFFSFPLFSQLFRERETSFSLRLSTSDCRGRKMNISILCMIVLGCCYFFIFVHNCFLPSFLCTSWSVYTRHQRACVYWWEKKRKKKIFYCILLWIYAHDCVVVVYGTCSVRSLSFTCFYTHLLSIVWYLDPIFFPSYFSFFCSRFMLKLTIVSLPLCTCVVLFFLFFILQIIAKLQ